VGVFPEKATSGAQTFSVDAALAFLTDGAAFGRILLLRRGPSLSIFPQLTRPSLFGGAHTKGSRKVSMFSCYTSPGVGAKSFSLVQNAFLQANDLPFRDVLTEEEIDAAFVAEDACFGEDEDDVYTPALTLWDGWRR
jgi:hypothetical protein